MNVLILIGGASASGKSLFTSKLKECLDGSIAYRRVTAFYDYAKANGIAQDQIFKKITYIEADDWFVNICCSNKFVISDIHYALQMNRYDDLGNVNVFDDYLPTISSHLINNLRANDIKVIAVYLHSSPEVRWQRLNIRHQKKERELKLVSLLDAQLEGEAEKNKWERLVENDIVTGIELDSENFSTEELIQQFLIEFDNLQEQRNYVKRIKIK